MIQRIVVRGGAALLVGIGLLFVAGLAFSKSRPETGRTGADADALVERVEEAVSLDAWERTGAVEWTFAGRNHHLWDRARGLSIVRWGNVEVLQRLDQRVGRAFRGGQEVHGDARAKLVEKAWAAFINDSFWLQPFANLSDDGVTRSVVEWDGEEALLVEYGSGGVTPGDAYLWLMDETGRPDTWRMWVKVMPIGGVRASWEGWTTLSTGAQISTTHKLGPATLQVTDVRGATTLAELHPGDDPFDRLVNW